MLPPPLFPAGEAVVSNSPTICEVEHPISQVRFYPVNLYAEQCEVDIVFLPVILSESSGILLWSCPQVFVCVLLST